MKAIIAGARNVAPYLLIELLMPGGTLLALLLWLKERRRKRHDRGVTPSDLPAEA